MNQLKLHLLTLSTVISMLASASSANSLDDKWLYAGAFKVDSGGRCLLLSSKTQFSECASQAFSKKMANSGNLEESMALMLNTKPGTLRPCTDKELSDAKLETLKDNELYGCLSLNFDFAGITIEDYFKKFKLLTIKFEQIEDNSLRIAKVVPNRRPLTLICEEFAWGDIEELVRPFLSKELQTALTMQGLSSEYRVSAAAAQALDESMPEAIKKVLKALIEADC